MHVPLVVLVGLDVVEAMRLEADGLLRRFGENLVASGRNLRRSDRFYRGNIGRPSRDLLRRNGDLLFVRGAGIDLTVHGLGTVDVGILGAAEDGSGCINA